MQTNSQMEIGIKMDNFDEANIIAIKAAFINLNAKIDLIASQLDTIEDRVSDIQSTCDNNQMEISSVSSDISDVRSTVDSLER